MKKQALLASAVAAVIGSSAFAAPTFVVTNLGVPTDGDPIGGYGPLVGYTAYKVDAKATAGQVIQGVDFSAQGAGGKVLLADLHQYWSLAKAAKAPFAVSLVGGESGKTPSGTNSTNGGPANNTGIYDSHFVISDTQLINVGSNLGEDNNAYTGGTTLGPSTSPFAGFNVNSGTGTPNDGWGDGTNLQGAYALQAPLQASTVTVLYLIIKDTWLLTHPDGHLATPEVAESGASSLPVSLDIPEPASASLLGLGMLGLLARRRKQI